MMYARRLYRALEGLTDEEVMSALQQGTPEALNVLQRRHETRIYHFLLKFTRDHQTAEDLMQETFLRVYRSRHSYRRIAKFTTWLFTIAGNLARTEYRKRRRVQFVSMQDLRQPDQPEWEIPDESFAPDDRFEHEAQAERTLDAIEALPERFRQVVALRGLQNLTYEEIHRLTGVPMGTIKSRIHRGRALLGTILEESVPA